MSPGEVCLNITVSTIRKFSFAARVVNVWNSLPDHVVDVNSLKGVLQRTFFISTNERLMYKFYKNCNYFIFK